MQKVFVWGACFLAMLAFIAAGPLGALSADEPAQPTDELVEDVAENVTADVAEEAGTDAAEEVATEETEDVVRNEDDSVVSQSDAEGALSDEPAIEDPVDPPVPAEPVPLSLAGSKGKSNGCKGGSCGKGKGKGGGMFGGCNLGPPWTLPQSKCAQRTGLIVGGWLEQGYTYNADQPADRFNGPVATNDRHNEYQMNQLWLYAVKPTDTGGSGWDIGGRLDVLYGSDYRFGINFGLEDSFQSYDQNYGIVIPQAYLEVAYNKLKVKLGHFAGILDYEIVPAVGNPFYSHSYSYGYTVPQLVTGVLADYQVNDRLSVQAGFHRGWMMFDDVNNNLDFMGGVKWTSADQNLSAAYAISYGQQAPTGAPVGDRFVGSFVGKAQLTQRLQYVLVQNYGYEQNGDPRSGFTEQAQWYGLNQYFLYKVNDCLSANLRAEWMRDDDGARIFGVPNVLPGVRTWPGGPGFEGNFFEVTAGLNWRPHANVLLRPEIRWDWYDGTTGLGGELPFDAGTSDDQLTAAIDLIITY